MPRRYITVDVFTDRAFGGNQLAVVLDAAGLSTAQMQAFATEFNYSETTFVLPPRDKANDAEVLAAQEVGKNDKGIWRVCCGRDAKNQISPTDRRPLPFAYPIEKPNQDPHR